MAKQVRVSIVLCAVAAVCLGATAFSSPVAHAEPEILTFTPVIDTYVDASSPTTSFSSAAFMEVDASPAQQSFLRFDVSGLAGRDVASVRLEMLATDGSVSGGNVWSMTDNTWTDQMTWDTRPAIDGDKLATFQSVAAGDIYKANLGEAVTGDGTYSFALDSGSNDGADWASSESANAPLLAVMLEPDGADAHSFAFVPSADTYVREAAPTSSFGTSFSLFVDEASPKQAFLRFDVHGLQDRVISGVRLVMTQRASSSVTGGRLWAITDDSWTEAMTWETRPAIDGPLLGWFGPVVEDTTYEIDLWDHVTGDGVYSFAIDSDSSDDARWYSQDSDFSPRLVVDLASPPGEPIDGLSQVADGATGSSDPTFYASNHRLVSTGAGRALAVHGKHKDGVRLAWMDPGSAWSSDSHGSVDDGRLLSGTGTGDWAASLVKSRGLAWAVIGAPGGGSSSPVTVRRIARLNNVAGPKIGPAAVQPLGQALGDLRPDAGVEKRAAGDRVLVCWTRRASPTRWELMTGWVVDRHDPTPSIVARSVLARHHTSNLTGTVVPTRAGIAVAARAKGALKIYRHARGDGLRDFSAAQTGMPLAGATPSGVGLKNGRLLVAAERSPGNVRVQRLTATTATTLLDIDGYSEPYLTSDGIRAWLLMIRNSDGHVVSRMYDPVSGWTSTDRTEIGLEGGGDHQWPNADVADGRLRVLFRGPIQGNRSEVLAFQRVLD